MEEQEILFDGYDVTYCAVPGPEGHVVSVVSLLFLTNRWNQNASRSQGNSSCSFGEFTCSTCRPCCAVWISVLL